MNRTQGLNTMKKLLVVTAAMLLSPLAVSAQTQTQTQAQVEAKARVEANAQARLERKAEQAAEKTAAAEERAAAKAQRTEERTARAEARGEAEAEAQQQGKPDAKVKAALETALEAGIPVTLLERKVAEGKAKGVPMDRIATAVQTRLNALLKAQTVLQSAGLKSTTEGELSVTADAVQAGVSATALTAVSQKAPGERRAVAVAVLTDLVALGHASDRALAQVTAALNRGSDALVNLQARTASEVRARGAQSAGAGVSVGGNAGARVELGGRGKGRIK